MIIFFRESSKFSAVYGGMPTTPDKSYLDALALRAKVFNELHPTISEKPDPAVSAAMDEEFKRKGYVLLYKNGEAMGAIVHTNPSEIAKGSKPIRVVDFTADPIHIPGVPSNVGPDDTLLLALRAEKEKLSPRGIAALERMEEQAKRNSENPQTPPTPEP